MRKPILPDCILERAGDMRLSNQIVERLRSILAGKNLIAHGSNLVRSMAHENRNQKNGAAVSKPPGVEWI